MTVQPTRDQLREAAEGHLRFGGGGDDLANGALALLDQLDRAERRIARLEAQASIRGRAVVMYRERARAAEARIKAVRDVHTGTVWPGVADKPVCDACDQMWPCATIRALD